MKLQTVQNIMHKQPIVVQCQTSLAKIISTFIDSQQTQLPVINSDRKLIGMISVIDCQKALLNSTYHCDQPVIVNDIMVKEFISLESQEHLSEVAIKTQQQEGTIFPVLKSGKLIGIVKRVDLLIELHNNLALCTQEK